MLRLTTLLLIGLSAQTALSPARAPFMGTTPIPCTAGSQTVASWSNTQSITSTDSNWDASSPSSTPPGSISWDNTSYLATSAGTGNNNTNLNVARCVAGNSTCLGHLLAGEAFFSVPPSATVIGVAFTFYRWQNSTVGSSVIFETNHIHLCASGQSWPGCTDYGKTGNMSAWPGSSSAGSETYGSSSDTWGGVTTASQVNSGLTFILQPEVDSTGHFDVGGFNAHTNGWMVTVTWTC